MAVRSGLLNMLMTSEAQTSGLLGMWSVSELKLPELSHWSGNLVSSHYRILLGLPYFFVMHH